ncbi:MAG TPA: TPM domain-containing protein, partial [Gammaproteobacteria bacterium]|nr:TPM domain-containing protein [Gammaproteobacteria bacterium]
MRSTHIMSRGGVVLLAALWLAPLHAANPADTSLPAFPALSGPVVDTADLLPADVEAVLTQKLAAYDRTSGNQVVVVTLPTLNGYDIADYGYQLGRHWGIGQKDKNTGALLIVDVAERKVRIEVGYGLEGTLTDALSFQIVHNIIVPRFKQGDFAGGIVAGTQAILTVLGDHAAAQKQQKTRERSGTGLLMLLIIAFALWPLIASIFRGGGPRGGAGGGSGWLGWMALGMLASSLGRGGSGFGGGFGGGGG